jgi:hypothetical protein
MKDERRWQSSSQAVAAVVALAGDEGEDRGPKKRDIIFEAKSISTL